MLSKHTHTINTMCSGYARENTDDNSLSVRLDHLVTQEVGGRLGVKRRWEIGGKKMWEVGDWG